MALAALTRGSALKPKMMRLGPPNPRPGLLLRVAGGREQELRRVGHQDLFSPASFFLHAGAKVTAHPGGQLLLAG